MQDSEINNPDADSYVAVMGGGMGNTKLCAGSAVFLVNLDDPDEGCDLNYSAIQATSKNINYSLSNSFGFGGTNASLIFRDVE